MLFISRSTQRQNRFGWIANGIYVNRTLGVLLNRKKTMATFWQVSSAEQTQPKTKLFARLEIARLGNKFLYFLHRICTSRTVWPEAIQTYLWKSTCIYLSYSSPCDTHRMRNLFMRLVSTLHIAECDTGTHIHIYFVFIFYALNGYSKCISTLFSHSLRVEFFTCLLFSSSSTTMAIKLVAGRFRSLRCFIQKSKKLFR